MDNWAITTSKTRGKHGLGITESACALRDELHISEIARNNRGIPWLMEQHHLECLLVEEENELVAHWKDGGHLAFHPGMAVPRIKQMKDTGTEMLTHIMQLEPDETVLDCTMGMANDSIVMAFAAAEGHITSLESSPVIYAVVRYGLQHWDGGWRMNEAMKRITPVNRNYEEYLIELAEDSYDHLYFDPMFERPILQSSGINPLRRAANYAPLTQEMLERARYIAKKNVIVKHRAGTLQSLQFDRIEGGRYSAIAYGILEK